MASNYPPTSKPKKGIIGKDVGFQPDPPTRKPRPRKTVVGPMKVIKPYKLNQVKTTRTKREK